MTSNRENGRDTQSILMSVNAVVKQKPLILPPSQHVALHYTSTQQETEAPPHARMGQRTWFSLNKLTSTPKGKPDRREGE